MLGNAVKTDDFSHTNVTSKDNESYERVGARIARAREACGLSVEELALRLGVRAETLKTWEAGETGPRPNRLTILAGVLNVTPGWLLFDCGDDPLQTAEAAELKDMRRELAALKSVLQTSLNDADRMLGNIDKMIESQKD